jgi:glucose-6-phosphate 1-dehydrogenase
MDTPTIIILVGITGDLAKRKLLPAIDDLKAKGQLPAPFKLVGITRHDNDQGYFKMNLDNADDYTRLGEHLREIERRWGVVSAQRLFYLSVAPTVSLPIIEHLGNSGLATVPNTKLLLEKPFGLDEQDAMQTISTINKYFAPEQQYRIDHYLAKNTVRALANQHLAPDMLQKISVIATESISIEGRAHFYEQTGALRDFVQSHLLQVAALVLSPTDRLAALRGFSLLPGNIQDHVVRGQYKGYREAAENPDSSVETFVAVTVHSKSSFFTGEVFLETGKAMDRKRTELGLYYKDGTSQAISLQDADNAYENVFYDAMVGNKLFFVTPEEVLQTWHILAPIQEAWKESDGDLKLYDPGSSGDDVK